MNRFNIAVTYMFIPIQATRLAQAMVTKYGMSTKVGMLYIDEKTKLGGATSKNVDDEINDLLSSSYTRAKQLLEANRKQLEFVANGLIEYESLSGAEVSDLISGKKILPSSRSQKPSRDMKTITNRPRYSQPTQGTSAPKNALKGSPPAVQNIASKGSSGSPGDSSGAQVTPINDKKAPPNEKSPPRWGQAFSLDILGWFSGASASGNTKNNRVEEKTQKSSVKHDKNETDVLVPSVNSQAEGPTKSIPLEEKPSSLLSSSMVKKKEPAPATARNLDATTRSPTAGAAAATSSPASLDDTKRNNSK